MYSDCLICRGCGRKYRGRREGLVEGVQPQRLGVLHPERDNRLRAHKRERKQFMSPRERDNRLRTHERETTGYEPTKERQQVMSPYGRVEGSQPQLLGVLHRPNLLSQYPVRAGTAFRQKWPRRAAIIEGRVVAPAWLASCTERKTPGSEHEQPRGGR